MGRKSRGTKKKTVKYLRVHPPPAKSNLLFAPGGPDVASRIIQRGAQLTIILVSLNQQIQGLLTGEL
jgi:hypothetical protein